MNIFISGSTGFIGEKLCNKLADEGHTIHALYRSESKINKLKRTNIIPVKGDILDPESLYNGMQNCEVVFHTAAFTSVWTKNVYEIYRLNVVGTSNIISAARKAGVKKVICTSTAGVIGPSEDHEARSENSVKPLKFFNHYESSKALLEEIISSCTSYGPEIIMVNPTRVYGPGALNQSNSVTKMIRSYILGKWKIVPGNGKSIGNYVYIDDVVAGHIKAMEKGKPGERYVLGGENVSYNEFFNILSGVSGKKHFLFKVPVGILMTFSVLIFTFSLLFNKPPMITPSLVKKFNHNWIVSSDKAQNAIGYSSRSLHDGIKETVAWLKDQNK